MQISLSTQADIYLVGSFICLILLSVSILFNVFYFFFVKKHLSTIILTISCVLMGILLLQQRKFIQEHKHLVTTCKSTQ